MTFKNIAGTAKHSRHYLSTKYLSGLLFIGIAGGIIGVLCGSVSILFGVIIAAVVGKIWINHNKNDIRQ